MSPPRKKQKKTPTRGKDGKFAKALVDTTPTGPASERLLGQVETMEKILVTLPMRDLLLAIRVSKRFRNIIIGSVKLKRALFLEPVACGSVSYLDWRYDDKEMYPSGMGLGEHLRGEQRDQRPKIYPHHWGMNRDDAGKYRIFVNPLLAEIFPVLQKNGCYFKELEQDLLLPMQYESASWRMMYFTQPPVDNMIMEEDSSPDPAIELDDDDFDGDDDGTANPVTTYQVPAAAAANPNPTTQAFAAAAAIAAAAPNTWVPVGQFVPGIPTTNTGGAGNAGAGNGGYWTVGAFSKWVGAAGIKMENLFYKLVDGGYPAWIEGRDLWEEYRGAEDLEKVVVGGK